MTSFIENMAANLNKATGGCNCRLRALIHPGGSVPPAHALTRVGFVPFNGRMLAYCMLKTGAGAVLLGWLAMGCASKEQTLPPLRPAALAGSPTEVAAALPGDWTIDVPASAEVMARTQFQPREVTMMRREGMAPSTSERTVVAERFDPKAYREARRYWADLLDKPDMRWRLRFNASGTGEHLAIVLTGSQPESTPFTWKLDGWRLRVEYPEGARFRTFEVEAPSAVELHYPMQPLGDYLVLRRAGK